MKDPRENDKPSVSLTLLMMGFIVAIVKLLFADMTVGDFRFGAFSGADFAGVVGALGAIYGWRKQVKKTGEGE